MHTENTLHVLFQECTPVGHLLCACAKQSVDKGADALCHVWLCRRQIA